MEPWGIHTVGVEKEQDGMKAEELAAKWCKEPHNSTISEKPGVLEYFGARDRTQSDLSKKKQTQKMEFIVSYMY